MDQSWIIFEVKRTIISKIIKILPSPEFSFVSMPNAPVRTSVLSPSASQCHRFIRGPLPDSLSFAAHR
jgi:hypothetical protein